MAAMTEVSAIRCFSFDASLALPMSRSGGTLFAYRGGVQFFLFHRVSSTVTEPISTFSFPLSGTAAASSLNHPVNSPDIPKILLISLLAGLGCGLGLAFVREQMDRSFHDAGDVEIALGLRVLATIPKIEEKAA